MIKTPSQQTLEKLFPAAVVVVASSDQAEPAPLFPEEEVIVARAVEKRRREFAIGRYCAREALRKLDVEPVAIPSRADRSPVWPAGIVGAITHCQGVVAAAVARDDDLVGIGLDAEWLERPLRDNIDKHVRTAAERERLPHRPDVDVMMLVFSAKEALHKCVAPISGVRLNFHEVEIDPDFEAGTFKARMVGARNPRLPDFARLSGRFVVTEEHVIAACFIARAGLV